MEGGKGPVTVDSIERSCIKIMSKIEHYIKRKKRKLKINDVVPTHPLAIDLINFYISVVY